MYTMAFCVFETIDLEGMPPSSYEEKQLVRHPTIPNQSKNKGGQLVRLPTLPHHSTKTKQEGYPIRRHALPNHSKQKQLLEAADAVCVEA